MSKGAISVITALLNIFAIAVTAQPRGLVFASYEAAQEQRTSLDLTANGPLCIKGNMELGFDLSFLPDRAVYFGYIFRLVNTHQQNVDLVYSQQDDIFEIILGERISGIRFRIDAKQLYHQWSRLRVRMSEDSLYCYVGAKQVGKAKLQLQDRCFRMLFGACRYGDFKSTDLPPMQLCNIGITVNGHLQYYWPLQTPVAGNIPDSIQFQPALALNATWAADLHAYWQPLLSAKVNGNASFVFDPSKEVLYIVARDTLYTFSAKNKTLSTLALASTRHCLLVGSQSFYHPPTQTLYNFSIDRQQLAAFDATQKQWTPPFDTGFVTAYWHANKFYSPQEDALYVLGGYGLLRYKNAVWRYRFTDKVWEQLSPKGDFFTPRYLSALGTTPHGDTAYILGGYGSTTGEQVANPHYLYDLMMLDVKRGTFKKVYNFPAPASSFVLAGSMVLQGDDYYALSFSNERYHSRLQLIKGSLKTPVYTPVGDTIPFAFQDNRAGADLFFCAESKQLLAVTLLRSANSVSTINIYSIAFPPGDIVMPSYLQQPSRWGAFVAGVVLLALIPYLFYRKPRKEAAAAQAQELLPASTASHPSILLFGSFTVTDPAGNDISRLFTPLLKELFLLIVLYTVKQGQGISPDHLNEILWNDKSSEAAKNNRAVNMRKLKTILEQLGDVTLKKEAGKWLLQYAPVDLYIDLAFFEELVQRRQQLDLQHIQQLLQVVKRGGFLHQTEYRWLDDIKSDISNQALDVLMQASTLLTEADAPLMISIADAIFSFDAVNEQALRLKCRSLVALGRHAIARNTYEKFVKEYRHMYAEDFPETYNVITG